MPARRLLPTLLTIALLLTAAAPAAAGGLAEVDGAVLRYTADDIEPVNVTIDLVGDVMRLEENGSRPSAGAGCERVDDWVVECAAIGVERIAVRLGAPGSDVRIRANLPAEIVGGPGDDLIVGGPAADVIDGGAGQDIIAGGGGADLLRGGSGIDLVTYHDRIGRDGALLGRRGGVTIAIGREGGSGARGEGDTIAADVEQVQGGAGNDRLKLRDGRATAASCGGGRDLVIADVRDTVEIDCEAVRVAPHRGGARIVTPTLPFPFVSVNDRARNAFAIQPLLPLQRGAIVLRVSCPPGVGLLELVGGLPCSGRIRFTRPGALMGIRRVSVRRGGSTIVRLPLIASRSLARRPQGLTVTATAISARGDVQRALTFRVKG